MGAKVLALVSACGALDTSLSISDSCLPHLLDVPVGFVDFQSMISMTSSLLASELMVQTTLKGKLSLFSFSSPGSFCLLVSLANSCWPLAAV